VTAMTRKTFVSNTARTSSRDATLAWTRLRYFLECPARLSRIRNAREVPEYVKTAELVPDVLCRGGDRGLIRDVELEGAGIRSNALRRRLPMLEVARSVRWFCRNDIHD
jgi:hypothetical protein